MPNYIKKNKNFLCIGIIWLFHISALIGSCLGYRDWFIVKTPLNLSLSIALFILCYPLVKKKQWLAFALFFLGGMFAEWLGVNYSLLFGSYSYGDNFGPKIDGVPFFIGMLWALLTFITASILDFTKLSVWAKATGGAFLMLVLDFFMEHSAPIFDFWTFEGNVAPLQNYIAWFLIALMFHFVLRFLKIEGNRQFALNLYLAQLLFFIFFYFR